MKTLHAYWENDSKHPLKLWVEKSSDEAVPSKSFSNHHPFALSAVVLPEILGPIVKEKKASSTLKQMHLSLPSKNKKPLHSSEFSGISNIKSLDFQAWVIPTLCLSQLDGIKFFDTLDEMKGLKGSTEVLFLKELFKVIRKTIKSGLFLPKILKDKTSTPIGLHSEWSFEQEHLNQCIEQIIPFFSGIFLSNNKNSESSPSRWIECFLNRNLNEMIRLSLEGEFLWEKIEEKSSRNWLASLTDKHGFLDGEEHDWSFLTKTLAEPFSTKKNVPFRLLFKLVEPDHQKEAWSLEFLIQDFYRTSPATPLKKLWQTNKALSKQYQNYAGFEDFVLKELTRAALTFPRVLEALKQSQPSFIKLKNREAYHFLTETSLKLQAEGYGVMLPQWWSSKKNRASAILKVKPLSELKEELGAGALLDYEWQVRLGQKTLSLEQFEGIIRAQDPLIKQGNEWIEIRMREIENAILYFDEKLQEKKKAISLSKALQVSLQGELCELGLPVTKIEAEGWVKSFVDFLFTEESFDLVKIPQTFKGCLRPYQHRGVSWLAFLQKRSFGICLADDMGLGKTIQFLAFLLYERRATARVKPENPDLLICPMSIVSNWAHELEKFSPSLKVWIHHGGDRLKEQAFKNKIKHYDLVISTYQLVLKDQAWLVKHPWNRITLDEAQNIKNEKAKQTLAIKTLTSRYRMALTGTPIENRLSELWSIMDFLNPGYLGSLSSFKRKYQKPIEQRGHKQTLENLHQLTRPFLLRRLKTDQSIIQDLPEKIEIKEFCDLTRVQRKLYQDALDELFGGVENTTGMQRRGLVLAMLTKLKQICNHPAQYLKVDDLIVEESGKTVRTLELLKEIFEYKEKTLIFTQYVEMGKLLVNMIEDELDVPVFFLHGGCSKTERERLITNFKSVKNQSAIFILSTKAGGVGLNLTEANHVIHYDRWWNPAVENQATDRAFRIGQKKNVQVHKFVCTKSFEEKIDQIIERKTSLQNKAITTGEGFLTEISNEELKEVLKLEGDLDE